jgi:AraC-like DNA-binding protein
MQPDTMLIACSLSCEALRKRSDSPLAALVAERAVGHKVIRSSGGSIEGLRRWCVDVLNLSAMASVPSDAQDRLLDETLAVTARALSTGEEDRGFRSGRRYLLARRARDFMLDRHANPPTVSQICTFLNTSERTLHAAFGDLYGVSPKRFLKVRRLFAARQALKSAAIEEQVSNVAMRLGFWDLGRFAGAYQAMFGELPSETLRRTRT